MPYGVDKKLGGDSPKNDAWMEKCVDKVMATGKDKGSAIAICKATMRKSKAELDPENFSLDLDLINEVSSFMGECTRKMIAEGKAANQWEAEILCQAVLMNNDSIDSSKNYLDKTLFKGE